MRIDVVTLFPEFVQQSAALGVSAGHRRAGCSSSAPGIRAISPAMPTAGWTNVPSAAGRAW